MSHNITDILGYREKEREIGHLLSEILKLLKNKQEEFANDIDRVIKDITKIYLIIPYLDIKKGGIEKAIGFLLNLSKSIRIAKQETIPAGFIGSLQPAIITFENTLVKVITLYKAADSKILHDLGIKLHAASKEETPQMDGEPIL